MRSFSLFVLLGCLLAFENTVNGATLSQAKQDPLKAYVLTNSKGQPLPDSGVRIGALDLKYETKETLTKYGIDQSLINKLTSYIGKSGVEAQQALKQNPLQFTQSQFNDVNKKVVAYWSNKLQSAPPVIKKNRTVRRLVGLAKANNWVDLLHRVAPIREKILQ